MARTIHIIGDSHSSIFTGLHGVCGTIDEWHVQAIPGFRVSHLGQFLAHSVGAARHSVHSLIRRCVRDSVAGDRIAFFFGEIDCRNHVMKHAVTDYEIESVAARVAEAYVKRAASLAQGRDTAFISLPPPTVAQHGNAQLPTVGTFEQRARAVAAFNCSLKAAARRAGAHFIDTHDKLATPAGEPNPAYFADGVHADPRALPHYMHEFVRTGWVRRASPSVIAADALAHVVPNVDAREMLPGRLDDPRAARRILIERAALMCKAHGAKRIAIWGAGRHTESMGIGAFVRAGLRVAAILDDAARTRGLAMHGVPITTPMKAPRGIDAVVVSSDAHEAVLLERARDTFGGTRTLIVPIYSWQSL